MVHVDRGLLTIRGARFRWGVRTFVMAIVNVTPDSFSGDGRADAEAAASYGLAQWNAGADLIDVGGESTRPGHEAIDERTEIERIVPVLRVLREQLAQAPISVDTLRFLHGLGIDRPEKGLGRRMGRSCGGPRSSAAGAR